LWYNSSTRKKIARELGIVGFNASNGWLQGWLSRYKISKSVKLYGEAADIDLAEAETKMNVVRQKLAESGYKPENIFNMDETGLYYGLLVKYPIHKISSCNPRNLIQPSNLYY
jgi:hypothetical protein